MVLCFGSVSETVPPVFQLLLNAACVVFLTPSLSCYCWEWCWMIWNIPLVSSIKLFWLYPLPGSWPPLAWSLGLSLSTAVLLGDWLGICCWEVVSDWFASFMFLSIVSHHLFPFLIKLPLFCHTTFLVLLLKISTSSHSGWEACKQLGENLVAGPGQHPQVRFGVHETVSLFTF